MRRTLERPCVYLDCEREITTIDVPHKRVSYGGTTFYIGRFPEGDYAIHKTGDKNGYAGQMVEFLMEDGTYEAVKGPYSCAGLFDFGTAERMASVTGIPDIAVKATRLTIGKNLSRYAVTAGGREEVFKEDRFKLGNWRERIKPEWIRAGLEAYVEMRGGSAEIVQVKSP